MIQFEALDELLKPIQPKIKQLDYVVWYIDANSVFCRLFSDQFADQLERIDESYTVMDIVTGFMNVIAHYRKYTTFKLHKKNIFYITFDTEITAYQKNLHPNYRKERMDRYQLSHPVYGHVAQILRIAYQFITALCSNFDDIHAIGPDTGLDSHSIQYLIRKQHVDKNCCHIMFTRNLPMIQMLDDTTFAIHCKRMDSYLITSDNAMYRVLYEAKQRKTVKDYVRYLPVSLYPFVAVLGGCDKFMKPSLLCRGPSDAMKLVYDLYQRKYITAHCTMYSFLDAFEQYRKDVLNGIEKGRKPKTTMATKPHMDQLIMRRRLMEPIGKQDVDMNELKEHLSRLPDDFYNDLINRYRVINISVTAAAATTEQILSVNRYLRNYQFDQNYLEHINELLAGFGPTMPLLELSVLNSSDPTGALEDYQGEWT